MKNTDGSKIIPRWIFGQSPFMKVQGPSDHVRSRDHGPSTIAETSTFTLLADGYALILDMRMAILDTQLTLSFDLFDGVSTKRLLSTDADLLKTLLSSHRLLIAENNSPPKYF